MEAVEKFDKDILKRLKRMLAQYGNIKLCACYTKLHRMTISRAIKNKEASGTVVKKMTDFLALHESGELKKILEQAA